MNEVQTTKADSKLSAYSGQWSDEEIAVIKNTVAKETTNTELAYFLSVCKSQELNPFNKEVWCYKQKGQLIIFTGRDGMLSKGQKHSRWNGMRSAVVRANDEFSIDIANAQITHKADWKEPSAIVGAYAIVFLKDGEPTISWVLMKEYDKGWNAWKTNPSDMILKTAEAKALKKAFGFSGIQIDEEWRNNGRGQVEPIPEAEVLTPEQEQELEKVNRTVEWISAQEDWGMIEASITEGELKNADIAKAYQNQKNKLCSK